MFKPSLPSGQGLLLVPCSSIHTCFMRFTIDVVYLSKDYKVLGIETIAPWRVGRHVPGTKMVLETAAGYAAQLQTGSSLICRQAPAEYSGLHGPER
ncbi:Uncharacterized conserved membrane protein, UPF0127 family [Sporobacter termitidis DSM 10068]|uniref:Uncharacterized conserved membrane protein, UPF0127 family n=2 Tax=Sporobacter TaxID=44748 RepID=A0A1M5Z3U2_9FIRM|nr:Uncharacterized conserved membrane protein, UPF0127 family [Sporobacter termitidis DSM 10068]